MAGLVSQLPSELLGILDQIVGGIFAEYPADQTEGERHRLTDLRRLRGK